SSGRAHRGNPRGIGLRRSGHRAVAARGGDRSECLAMAWRLKGKYAIVGVGQSPIGRVPNSSALGLLALAMRNALEDAGLGKQDVDGLITRGPDDVYCHHQRIGEILGLNVPFSTSLDNGGASQCLAVALACTAIEAGLCQTVICGY